MKTEHSTKSPTAGLFPLEDVFSSRGRVRILFLLSRYGMLNITRLSREASLSYESTKRHLRALVAKRVINEQRFGRIRLFSINKDNPIGRKVEELFDLGPSKE